MTVVVTNVSKKPGPRPGFKPSKSHRAAMSKAAKKRHRRERERRTTLSGVDLKKPDSSLITLDSWLEQASYIRRFNGRGISILEHEVDVSKRVRLAGCSVDMQIAALVHDGAAEHLAGDIISPAKACIPDWKQIEHGLELAALRAIGLEHLVDMLHCPEIKLADEAAQEAEAVDIPCKGWGPRRAQKEWRAAFDRLLDEAGYITKVD